jgi:CBS domain-containing protein
MAKKDFSAALLVTDNNEHIGIVTDHDLRERVVAEKLDVSEPVFKIMSTPIISIPANSFVFQALLNLNEKGKKHLAVKNIEGEIIGVVSSEELHKVHLHSSTYLVREIENAETVEDIISSRKKLPRLVKTLVDSGAKTKNITQIITYIFDAIVHKLITFSIDEIGPPPTKFAFIALGSAGRAEQTLISDQDNGIIIEDVPESEKEQGIKYFQQLGTKVCDWLNDCGYVYCKGNAMAKNPKWTQLLQKWKDYFHGWIVNSNPQDLLELSIFFDFRCVYGEIELVGKLRDYLFKAAKGQAGFFQHLAKNSLYHKPPVGLLGKIVVESKGEHPKTFDIKTATMPVTDFARIYAIQNKIRNTNSLDRLHDLRDKGVIENHTYEELVQVYSYLMNLRFKHHASQITNNKEADNFIDPNEFTRLEQQTLKNAFSQISSIQKKLNYDFSGEAL